MPINEIDLKLSVTESTFLLDAINHTLDSDIVSFVPSDDRTDALKEIRDRINEKLRTVVTIF